MKLDAHVHTRYSGRPSLYPLSLIMRESYTRPERVYRLARARGMGLVPAAARLLDEVSV